MNPEVISRQWPVVSEGRSATRSVLDCGSAPPLWLSALRSAALAFTLGLLTPVLHAAQSAGGDFSLVGGVSTGGGQATGGDFSVTASADEAASGPLSGGDFEVTGGLVAVTVVTDGDVALGLTATDSQVTLTWPAEATGYVLEFSPAVGDTANWQPVTPAPAANSFTTTFNQPLRFYRLRKR